MEAQNFYLDPVNQAFVDASAGSPAPQNDTTAEYRQGLEDMQKHTPITGVTVTSFTVPFEDGVKAYIFRPEAVKADQPLPAMVYIHGGGWKAGSVKSYDSICRELVLKSGCALVFPEYTRVPEARFPSLHEECYVVAKFLHEHGVTKHLNTKNGIAIAGDSAGGQLATATTMLCSTRKPKIPVLQQILISPILNLDLSDRITFSEWQFFNGPFINMYLGREIIDEYIPNTEDRKNELASPINISAARAKLQPPTLIVVSSVDPLRDDGINYAKILQKAGVDCAIVRAEGQIHDSYFVEATRKAATPSAMVTLMAVTVKEALEKAINEPTAEEHEDSEPETKAPSRKRRKARRT